jgi:hypothetical protein
MKNLLLLLLLFGIKPSYSQWFPLTVAENQVGLNDAVLCQTVDQANNTLILGGKFSGNSTSFLPFISRWDGTTFSPIGEGFNAPVRCLIWFEGSLYAGGDFTSSGSTPINHIARWTGNGWEPVAGGFNGSVRAFEIYNNRLYAGGSFDSTETTACSFLARLSNDQTSWEQAGNGLTFSGSSSTYVPGVYSLEVYNGLLYVGGRLNASADGTQSFDGALVRWNGFTFADIINYFSTTFVSCMAVYDNHLMLGGGDLQFIAEYDGANFLFGAESILPPFTVNNPVYALLVFENKLFVGGSFSFAGTMAFEDEFILFCENEQWYTLNLGLNAPVYSLGNYNNSVIAGGAFTETNSGQIVNHIARWSAPLEFDAVVNSISCNGSSDGSIELFPLTGTPPYSYLWSTGSDSAFVSGLADGIYYCTLTDANGAIGSYAVQLANPEALQCSFEINADDGSSNGTAAAQVIGGTAPFEFLWSNGSTESEISALEAGIYSLLLTDANGCILNDTIIIPLSAGTPDALEVISQLNVSSPVISTVFIPHLKIEYCRIYDSSGRMSLYTNSNSGNIDVSMLPSGYYTGIIETHKGQFYRFRFIKQ